MNHRLFKELEALCPGWQDAYATLHAAAQDAGLDDLYRDYLSTKAGAQRARALDVPDVLAANERAARRVREQRGREWRLLGRAGPEDSVEL